jgi:pyruvate dehydrogenase E2 component (dihydrolipoamide acetyltransferase)
MTHFKFADIGEGIHEGKLLKWFFEVGDSIQEGDTLCIIETDKVNAEIPSPVAGKLEKIGAKVGEIIRVGELLALINDVSNETPKNLEPIQEGDGQETAGVVGQIEVNNQIIASSEEFIEKPFTESKKIIASPIARKLASDQSVDLSKIKGSGDFGRILKSDIENVTRMKSDVSIKESTPKTISSIPSANIRRVPITSVRKAIVKAMTESTSIIPHTVLMDEIDVSQLVAFRNEQKLVAASLGIKLTYMPFIIKAATLTIKDFPIFNSSYDHQEEVILYKDFINMGIATDTPQGLMVPNIKNADQLSIFNLAKKLEILVQSSLDRSIQLSDIQNGTFTITNYGAFDATYGTPIIKYPEVAILGIGKIAQKPIVKDGEITIAWMMPISLAVDHRIIDGADAGRFAMQLKSYLQNPLLLLMR